MRSRTAGVMTTLMRNGRDRRSGKPVKCHAILERELLFGTRSADYIRASGHSGRIQRPNTWLHPNASLKCQIFPLHRRRRPYMALSDASPRCKTMSGLGATTDIGRRCGVDGSVANDPKATSSVSVPWVDDIGKSRQRPRRRLQSARQCCNLRTPRSEDPHVKPRRILAEVKSVLQFSSAREDDLRGNPAGLRAALRSHAELPMGGHNGPGADGRAKKGGLRCVLRVSRVQAGWNASPGMIGSSKLWGP